MSQPIISVENLGKSYLLRHQARQQSAYQYLTLREEAARWAKRLFNRRGDVSLRPSHEAFWALKNVSFEVHHGDALAIIGRNGAGKSTLLKVLSRITEPTSGRAILRGRIASLLEVGTGFHPELTGRENIFLNGAILGMTKSEIRSKFDEIVDFAEIEKFLDTPVKRYSSGMYVRLAFSVAAHLEPEILIVDEVLAVGDAAFQKKCLGRMNEVRKEGGRTVIFVSHNLTAVRTLCDHAILLKNGQAIQTGTVDDVIRTYQSDSTGSNHHKKWDKPNSEACIEQPGITLIEARLIIKDSSTSILLVDTPFEVSFCIYSLRTAVINLSPHYLSSSGEVVFAAPSPPAKIHPGENWLTCQIPGNLLNDGLYSIHLSIVENSKIIQNTAEALTFEVADTPRTGSWHGKWPGLIRPSLPWILPKGTP